jgi:hypothetical protein
MAADTAIGSRIRVRRSPPCSFCSISASCGPLASSLFHHRPEKTAKPPAKIELAYHKAEAAIQKLVDLVAA